MAATVYVGKLPPGTTEPDLVDLFAQWKVLSVTIPRDFDTQQQKNFAFVVLQNSQDVRTAIGQLNGNLFKGRKIVVALPRQNKTNAALRQHLLAQLSPSKSVIELREPAKPAASQISNVYLCDATLLSNHACNALSSAVRGGFSNDIEILSRITSQMVAPLAVYTARIAQHQRESSLLYSLIRSDVERIARFFLQLFYRGLEEQVPRDIQCTISGAGKIEGSILRASTGQAIDLASYVAGKLKASKYELLQRGIQWWMENEITLKEITRIGNKATHVTAAQLAARTLSRLNNALADLCDINWALVADLNSNSTIILNGPNAKDWRIVDQPLPSVRLLMSPFVVFRGKGDQLEAFQSREGSSYYFIQIGPSATSSDLDAVVAEPALARQVERCCPVDTWKQHFTRLESWQSECGVIRRDEKLDFHDLRKEAPKRLYGRDDELQRVENFLAKNAPTNKRIIIIVGPKGIGKSAFIWKVLDRGRSLRSGVIPFFFREGDRRCDLQTFFKAGAIEVSKHKQISLQADSWHDRLREAVTAKAQEATQNDPILLLDGLDALEDRDLFQLLKVIDALADTASWVCTSQPRAEIVRFAEQNNNRVMLFSLGLLSIEARRRFLFEELQANNPSSLLEADRSLLMSNSWIDKVIEKRDAGLPLYIRAVLDSAIELQYRDPDRVPPTLEGVWQQSVHRLSQSPLAIKILTLLSAALAPLSVADIKEITHGIEPNEIEDILRRHWCFVLEGSCWSIFPEAFRQYIRGSSSPDVRVFRLDSGADIIKWASNWKIHKSLYALEFLPRHLEAEDDESLFRLAFDENFMAAQAEGFPHRPELPLDTMYCALKLATKRGLPIEIFTLALHHAEYVARSSRITTLANEFKKGNYFYVAQLASFLDEEHEQVLWKLLAAIGAVQTNDRDSAKRIVAEIKVPSRGRGFQTKYEEVAAVLLAVLVGSAAHANLDLSSSIWETGDNLLGRFGRRAFFNSLVALTPSAPYALLLPNMETPRRYAIRAVVRAFARHREFALISQLAASEPFADQIRLEAVAGSIETGDVTSATHFAVEIQKDDLRRIALCNIATQIAVCSENPASVAGALWAIQQFWHHGSSKSRSIESDCPERPSDIKDVILRIVKRTEALEDVGSASIIIAMLGTIHECLFGGDSFIRRAEDMEATVDPRYALHARFEVLRAYIRVKRWPDASRIASLFAGRFYDQARADVLAARIQSDEKFSAQNDTLSIQLNLEFASALSRTNQLAKATETLLEILLLIHSDKADNPSLWGKPRILGEIAGALQSIGETDKAIKYFDRAERHLKEKVFKRPDWHGDRAFALVDLATAVLPDDACMLPEELFEAVDGVLHDACGIVDRSKKLNRISEKATHILSEIWEIRQRYKIGESAPILAEAVQIAHRSGSLLRRIKALVEIARSQAKLGEADAARDTLDEAKRICSRGGPDEYASVLLGQALCGQIEGLRSEIENTKTAFQGDARESVCRAEVEMWLHIGEFDHAMVALKEIRDSAVRAHAARDIARKYAGDGAFKKALWVVQQEIGARRSELIPDVAEAIAAFAAVNSSSRGEARSVLLDLLRETAAFLDGTYRLIAAIIHSRVFELDSNALIRIAHSLDLLQSDQDESRVPIQ